jgi:tetratricopeptide (TPR) repeat protein
VARAAAAALAAAFRQPAAVLRRLAAARAAPLVVGALAFAVYAGTLGHGFVYDDGTEIVENPWIWNPGDWVHLVTEPVWAFTDESATNYYRPVPMLLYAVAARFSGREPFAFHLRAVLMHALACAAAVLMLRRVTGPARAFAAGAFFAVHPIHSEVVAWVSGGPDAHAAVFLFLALWLGSRAVEEPRSLPLALAAGVAAVVACFAKEAALVAPVLMLTLPLLPSHARDPVAPAPNSAAPGPARSEPTPPVRQTRRLRMAAAFAVSMMLYLVVRAVAVGSVSPSVMREGMDATSAIGTALALVPRYVALAFVPWRPVPDRFVAAVSSPFAPAALAGIATLAAALAAWLALHRRAPAAAWGVVWLFVPLAPALMVAFFPSSPQADRYLYIPAIGACILVAEALGWLARRARPAARAVAVTACALIVATGGVATHRAAAIWHDSETLGRAGIALEPRSIVMRLELIHALLNANRLDEARDVARAAAALAPWDRRTAAAIAYVEARAAMRSGGDPVAIYQAAVAVDPARATLWAGLSGALLSAGRPVEAIEAAERTLALDRFNQVALVNLGTARGELGDIEGQEREARRLLAINDTSAGGWLNLGAARLRLADLEGAEAALTRAARLDPSSARAQLYLSWVASKRGDRGAALERARRATTLDPNDAEAWNRLGAEEAASGDFEAARAAWEKAVALSPGHEVARENLRRLLERQAR